MPTFHHGDTLAYDDVGDGEIAVVLLPGMGDLRGAYRHLVPRLVAEGLRVVALDLRGHGDSGVGFGSFGPDDVAGDVIALLDHLGLQRAVLVGNSAAGGAVAWAAVRAPARVAGIALLGPVVADGGGAAMKALARVLFLPPWGARLWGWFYRTLFRGGVPADHDAHVAAVVAALRDPRRRAAMLEHGTVGKPGDRIADVRCPALVVMGTADPDFPDAAAEARRVGELLRAEVVLLDGVGHYPHQERPDDVARALVPFARSAWRAQG